MKRGINLGGWLSQCDYSRERLDGFIKKEDIEKIASWGLDHVRLPIDYNVIQHDDGSMDEEGLSRIDRAVDMATASGLGIILDLHKTRGYSFDKDVDEAGFFENPEYQESFYRIWETFAGRYGEMNKSVRFELLNEVNEEKDLPAWKRIARECIGRIRSKAPDTYILMGSYLANSVKTVKDLDPPCDDRVIYNFHCYDPLRFTHQGAYWIDDEFPTLRIPFEESGVSEEYYEELFASAIQKAEKDGTTLYCGEYGVIDVVSPEDTLKWYRILHSVFEKHGIGRAAWSYKEMDFGISDSRMDSVRGELLKYL